MEHSFVDCCIITGSNLMSNI